MKVSNIEKMIIGIICLMITIMIIAVVSFVNTINEAGGLTNVIIQAGKEINSIAAEIDK